MKHWLIIDVLEGSGIAKCKGVNKLKIVKLLCESLKKYPYILEVDRVLIETQPTKRPVMEWITSSLSTFYLMNGVEKVYTIPARNKFKMGGGFELLSGKKNYYKRKKMGIEMTRKVLTQEKRPKLLEFFNANSKKDDLADSFLQCLYYIGYRFTD